MLRVKEDHNVPFVSPLHPMLEPWFRHGFHRSRTSSDWHIILHFEPGNRSETSETVRSCRQGEKKQTCFCSVFSGRHYCVISHTQASMKMTLSTNFKRRLGIGAECVAEDVASGNGRPLKGEKCICFVLHGCCVWATTNMATCRGGPKTLIKRNLCQEFYIFTLEQHAAFSPHKDQESDLNTARVFVSEPPCLMTETASDNGCITHYFLSTKTPFPWLH